MDNSLKDRVLEATDIVAIIGERVRLVRKGKDYLGLCPFHPDHKPSMAVSPTKRIFKCWSCGAGGDVIRFVEKLERIDFRAALAKLAERAGIAARSTPRDEVAERSRQELLATLMWAREHFRRNLTTSDAGRSAFAYAQRRGLSDDTIQRFGIGFAHDGWDDVLTAGRRAGLRPELLQQAGLVAANEAGRTYDRFRNRLIFPICDPLGRTIAFGGRALGDDPAKYLNSPETALFSKSRVLYGFDQARRAIEKERAVVVVEGYLDAVLLSQHGFTHAVATLGTAMSDAHVKLLRPLVDRIVLCFDSDQAGIRAADRAVEVTVRSQVRVDVLLLAEKDPAECVVAGGAGAFAEQLKNTQDALQFKWSHTLRAFGGAGGAGRRAAVDEFVRFVAGAAAAGALDPLDQNLLIGRLSELLGVPPDEAFGLFARARRRPSGSEAQAASTAVGRSDYVATLRGLPAGLVTAAETVLGLLLSDPGAWRLVTDAVAAGMEHSETWQRLYAVLLEVQAEYGEYSLEDVQARCEDSALCEAVERAVGRVAGVPATAEFVSAASARLASELDVLRMGDLRAELHPEAGRPAPDAAAFQELRELARKHRAPLPAGRRRGLTVRPER